MPRLTYANVTATLALFIALGGGAYAATALPKNSVGTAQIKKNAVTGAKIKSSAVTSSDVKNGALLARDFKAGELPAGPAGPAGLKGDKGDKGDTGATGPSTGPAGGDLAGNYPDPQLGPGTVGTSETASRPAVNLGLDGDFSVPNGGSNVPLEQEIYDTASMHDNVTNPHQVSIPVDGVYLLAFGFRWAENDTGRRLIIIESAQQGQVLRHAENANTPSTFGPEGTGAYMVRLEAGDTLDFEAFQNSGGALSLEDNSPSENFAVTWIAP